MDKLKFIGEELYKLNIPYEFLEWTGRVTYPYCVGEITEEPIATEDGAEQSTMLLTVFHREKMVELLEIKEAVKRHFDPVCGLRGNTGSGAIAVYYDGSFPIPSGEAGLKKIQINLKVIEQKGRK